MDSLTQGLSAGSPRGASVWRSGARERLCVRPLVCPFLLLLHLPWPPTAPQSPTRCPVITQLSPGCSVLWGLGVRGLGSPPGAATELQGDLGKFSPPQSGILLLQRRHVDQSPQDPSGVRKSTRTPQGMDLRPREALPSGCEGQWTCQPCGQWGCSGPATSGPPSVSPGCVLRPALCDLPGVIHLVT